MPEIGECSCCHHDHDHNHNCPAESRKPLIKIGIAAALFIIAFFIPEGGIGKYFKIGVYVLAYLVAGGEVLLASVKNIAHGRIFDEVFLMAVASLGAFALQNYSEAVAVMIFYNVGEYFEDRAVMKSRRSVKKLMDITPRTANVIRDGKEITVKPEQVNPGEIISVKPGEKIPLDGVIVSGITAVNEAMLTGESVPADKFPGETVYSGCINLSGAITVKVTHKYADGTAARIIKSAKQAAERKAKSEKFITKFAKYYTPAVVITAVVFAVAGPWIFKIGYSESIRRALTFLVVSCPCALVISVPLAFVGGIGAASEKGISFKGAQYLETLAQVDTFVFDKTGTLTKGVFKVCAVHPTGISETELMSIAKSVESRSNHPLAESICAAENEGGGEYEITDFTEYPGRGIKCKADGKEIILGNSDFLRSNGIDVHECHLTGTSIHIAADGAYAGHIIVGDELKPDAADTLKNLKKLGAKKLVILTGDNEATAKSVAESIGADEVYAKLLPDQKLEKIKNQQGKCCFVGDGINDTVVLSGADVGIAVTGAGNDAAVEAADIVLYDGNTERIAKAYEISKKTSRTVKENIILSLAVKIGALILGAFGVLNMWAAIIADVGVMVVAVLNSMRLLYMNKKGPRQ